MLLVLEPLAFVLLTVIEGVDTIALTAAFLILALIPVAIGISSLTFSLGFAGHHFAAVLTAITGDSGAERYLLRIAKEGHGGQTYRKNIMFQSVLVI